MKWILGDLPELQPKATPQNRATRGATGPPKTRKVPAKLKPPILLTYIIFLLSEELFKAILKLIYPLYIHYWL